MLGVERRKKIMELLLLHGNVVVSDLSKRFNVTEETIRRDLEKLEKEGQLIRTHGGAYLSEYVTKEYPIALREIAYVEEKKQIATISAELIQSGDTIMLDASTTSLFIARFLKRMRKKVTVITNALKVEMELADQEQIKLVSTGGTLRTSSLSHVGYAATRSLATYFADKAFVSCTAVHPNKGLMDSNEYEAEVRKRMLAQAEQKILVADHTKFGKTAFNLIATIDDIDMVIVDRPLSEEWRATFESHGVEVRHFRAD
ncbi:MAG: DeoR/GlpR transcriptional regulator, partial [Hydrogenibacillus sp.]|nr:DeoR/GlpR transcriptional regulator [Hydrogenibacillus sp.]